MALLAFINHGQKKKKKERKNYIIYQENIVSADSDKENTML